MQDSSRPPPATGYPYPYPNPHQPPANGYPAPPPQHATAYSYPNPYYAPPRPSPRVTLYRRLFVILLSVIIILGAIWLILVLVLRPRFPDVNLTSFSVSKFNVTDMRVTGVWDLRFQVRNPNSKMSLSYDDITCFLLYRRDVVGRTGIPPFAQGTKDETPLDASLSATDTYIPAIDRIREDRASGRVSFNLKMEARLAYRYGSYRGRRRYVVVWCPGVVVNLSGNKASGKMDGPPRECRLG